MSWLVELSWHPGGGMMPLGSLASRGLAPRASGSARSTRSSPLASWSPPPSGLGPLPWTRPSYCTIDEISHARFRGAMLSDTSLTPKSGASASMQPPSSLAATLRRSALAMPSNCSDEKIVCLFRPRFPATVPSDSAPGSISFLFRWDWRRCAILQ